MRRRARRCREISPACSSTWRCLVTAGWLMGNGAATSRTPASPSAKRARIARLVGSERAPKARSSSAPVSSAVVSSAAALGITI